MIINMMESENETIMNVAKLMLTAAKTAPKASGKDKIVGAIITGDEKNKLAEKMRSLFNEYGNPIFERDSHNVDDSPAVVLLGAKSTPFGLSNCSMCGFPTCRETREAGSNCVFNITDLGIAIGSAVSVAADNRIDNRVMYSVGKAAIKLGFLDGDIQVCYGIPLSATSKSIFFDRNKGATLLK